MNPEPLINSRRSVIDALLQHGKMSRSNLAETTGLSRSAITEVTQGLLDSGLLEELPVVHAGERRGRPSVLLAFSTTHGYFLGGNVSDRASLLVMTNLRGEIVGECATPVTQQPAETAAAMRKGVAQLLRTTGVAKARVLGAGIAVTGIVDQESGTCRYSAALNWRDVPIGALIQRATGIRTHIDNDANAVAIGQKLFGIGREVKHYSSLILGRNIGCAHFINNRLYRGHDGGAGEIGHITLDPQGPLCRCGRAGCLDMFAGGAALLSAAEAVGLAVKSVRELEVFAASGSTEAIALLRRGGQALGLAVASLVQINNPEAVLFADVEGFGNGLFRTTTRQTIENNILPRFLATQLVFESIDQRFLSRSAASMALQEYLNTLA